jgi:hypothetical protein
MAAIYRFVVIVVLIFARRRRAGDACALNKPTNGLPAAEPNVIVRMFALPPKANILQQR